MFTSVLFHIFSDMPTTAPPPTTVPLPTGTVPPEFRDDAVVVTLVGQSAENVRYSDMYKI